MSSTTTVDVAPAVNVTSDGAAILYFAQLMNSLTGAFNGLEPNYPANSYSEEKLMHDEDIIKADVIVVGGGTSGCIMAARLSEFADVNVLLVEAGTDPPVEVEIPRLWPSLMKSEWDWFYKTESSEFACLAMKDRQCAWPKGKMVGGSASMNAMYSVRGNPKDYDGWRDCGNEGWGYEDVLPYFKKLETAKGAHLDFNIHGTDGPIGVEFVNNTRMYYTKQIEYAFENAAKQAGIPFVHDCSTETRPCVTRTLFTVKDGVRSHPGKAYLIPAAKRDNLKVMKGVRVLKVLTKKFGRKIKAYGILMDVGNGEIVEAQAKLGVVLCAGSVETPHLLMLSGIGPAGHLKEFDIDVVVNLEGVGQNLQDHIIMSEYLAKYSSHDLAHEDETEPTDPMYEFLVHRDGFYSSPMFPAIVFVNSSDQIDYPDIQFLLEALPPLSPTIRDFCEAMNFVPDIADSIVDITTEDYTLNFHLGLLRPKSQGRLMLSSNDPWEAPKIINGYLTDPEDVKTIIAGLKYADMMMDTAALGFKKPITLPFEECDQLDTEGNKEAFLECYIRHFMTTVFHQCGTCKMGPLSDPLSVVDHRLRVHGVGNLMIADASIFPSITSGNIQMAVMMVAEKAAELAAENWNLK